MLTFARLLRLCGCSSRWYSHRLCLSRPKYSSRCVSTPESPAAHQTYTWEARESDETRLGAILQVRAVSSRFLASAARPAAHFRAALDPAVSAAVEGIHSRYWWCRGDAYSLCCHCSLVPNHAGTRRICRVFSRRLHGQQHIFASRSTLPCQRQSSALICTTGGVAATRGHCAATAHSCQITQIQRVRAVFAAFPRVGCTTSSAFPRRARPCCVSGSRRHSFALLVVSWRRVLTALPLHLCAVSRLFAPESTRCALLSSNCTCSSCLATTGYGTATLLHKPRV